MKRLIFEHRDAALISFRCHCALQSELVEVVAELGRIGVGEHRCGKASNL
jgi:hypothetical protein